MMAALAEFERALISERTRAGMAAARAQGRHIGRPPSLTLEQCAEARRSLELGADTLSMVAQRYGVHPRTLLRLVGKEAVSPTVVPRE
jgi:DNA invertase Pin-like site-specific DNA recombinase